jgi:hypothetical protein
VSDSWGDDPEQAYMDRPPAYVDDDGDVCYRASALGLCDKALAAIRLGTIPAAPPPKMQRVFDEGHRLEQDVLAGGLGALVEGESERQYRFKFPVKLGTRTVYITCTADEVIAGAVYIDGKGNFAAASESSYLVREAKAFGDDYWGKWKKAKAAGNGFDAFPGYAAQVSVQMYAAEHEFGQLPVLEFVVGLKGPGRGEDGKPDASLPREIVGWDSTLVTEPPVKMSALKLKLMRVEKLVQAVEAGGELPASCELTYPCPVYFLHGDKPAAGGKLATEEPDAIEDDLLDSLAAELALANGEYTTLMAQANLVDQRRKALKEGLKAWFEDRGQGEGGAVRTARYRLVYKVEDRAEGIIKAHKRRTYEVERVTEDAIAAEDVAGATTEGEQSVNATVLPFPSSSDAGTVQGKGNVRGARSRAKGGK